jgi:recombination protein RecA
MGGRGGQTGSPSIARPLAGVRALPTGFASLDKALGVGGLPRGRIVEIFGPASCGKTALALQMVGFLQRSGGAAAWIDADHSFDAAFATELGVDVSHLPVAAPDSTEAAGEMTCRLVGSGVLDLVVIDSAAALTPQAEVDSDLALSASGLYSRALGSALRKLATTAARCSVCVLVVNQTRIRPDWEGRTETSAGGPPLKLYAAARVALAASGRRVKFRIVKNKLAVAFATGILEWRPPGTSGSGPGPGFVEPL